MLAEMSAQEYIGWIAHIELSAQEAEEQARALRR
jgi:hypothetical protein